MQEWFRKQEGYICISCKRSMKSIKEKELYVKNQALQERTPAKEKGQAYSKNVYLKKV